jgi:hypothetical protein
MDTPSTTSTSPSLPDRSSSKSQTQRTHHDSPHSSPKQHADQHTNSDYDDVPRLSGEGSATYIGQLNEHNKFHGTGSIAWPDGRKYVGQWRDNVIEGTGVMRWEDGSVYKGDFRNGLVRVPPSFTPLHQVVDRSALQREGKGVHTFADGGVYSGMFKEGKRHGWGRRVYADGRIYEGDYDEELQDGTGVMKWPNGSEYRGAFRQGRKHGHGRMYWAHNGETYEGDWYHDLRYIPTPCVPPNTTRLSPCSWRKLTPSSRPKARTGSAHVHGRARVQGILLQELAAWSGTHTPAPFSGGCGGVEEG